MPSAVIDPLTFRLIFLLAIIFCIEVAAPSKLILTGRSILVDPLPIIVELTGKLIIPIELPFTTILALILLINVLTKDVLIIDKLIINCGVITPPEKSIFEIV